MSIQFRCSQCGQPIEVDDEHAGQTAACPYCRHLVTVPAQSTYESEGAVPARPAGSPEDSVNSTGWAAEQHAGDQVPPYGPGLETRHRTAVTLGNYALICTALVVILFGVAITRGMVLMVRSGALSPTSQMSQDDLQKLQMYVGTDPWVFGPQAGAMFFVLAGLVLGIVSLIQYPRGNWRGIVSVIVGGLFVLCVCGATVLQLAGFPGSIA